jgi:hypothetical protein
MRIGYEHGFARTTLEWLLDYDGRRHYYSTGHFLKFEIRVIEPSDKVPHGIAYSFTFHRFS